MKDWSRKFDEPIPLPNGKRIATLRDAATYITKLSKTEHDTPEWQAAMEVLILVAEHNGPTMFARIGVMRALNRNVDTALPELAGGQPLNRCSNCRIRNF